MTARRPPRDPSPSSALASASDHTSLFAGFAPRVRLRLLLVCALVAAVAACIPFLQRRAQALPAGSVELVLSAGQPGAVQVFYDRGAGFNEADSVTASFAAGGPWLIPLDLPAGKVWRLRLDPTSRPDALVLHALRLRATATAAPMPLDLARLKPLQNIARVRLDTDGLRFDATSGDPGFLYVPDAPFRVRTEPPPGYYLGVITWIVAVAALFFLGVLALDRIAPRLAPATRLALWLCAALAVIGLTRLPGLGDPLLDWHSFRQTQTALTAQWFARDGVSLPAYPLPVLGRPWSAPMEFPTYQLAVASLHVGGMPLDLAARGFAFVTFLCACGLLAWLLLRRGCPVYVVAMAGLFAWLSPFALVWSRAALIEFTAVLLGLAYIAFALVIAERGFSAPRLAGLLLTGAAAALTKITSFTVFWPVVLLLAAHRLWLDRSAGADRALVRRLAGWSLALGVPLLAAVAWTHAADAVKARSPHTAWLMSHAMNSWNFGALSLRFDADAWFDVGERIHRFVLPWLWPFALAGLPGLFRLPARPALVALGLCGGALATVLVFFNLYRVHDYYLCAVALPVWLCAAAGLNALARRLPGPSVRLAVGLAVAAFLALASYNSSYVRNSYRDHSADEVFRFAAAVRARVGPEEELVIFGDDWNPRLPYYAERRALMVKVPVVTDDAAVAYVALHQVRNLVAALDAGDRLTALFPAARPVAAVGAYTLYRLP